MTTLPKDLRLKEIQDMAVGEVGYTLPWAIGVKADGEMEMRCDYPVMARSDGNYTAKITMRGTHVEVSKHSIRREKYREGSGDFMPAWHPLPVMLTL